MANRLRQALVLVVSVYASIALIGAFIVFGEREDLTLSAQLIIALMIAVGSVLAASWIATYLHRSFSPQLQSSLRPIDYGPIFQRYVVRFSWFVAPIVASYGVFRLVELLLTSVRMTGVGD